MVGVAKRMSKLTELMHLKIGDGAIVLPPEVRKIHMDFAVTKDPSHAGPRIFWRNQLRRLKYHNPRLECTIARTTSGDDPATMTLHIASPTSASDPPATPSSDTTDTGMRVEKIDIKSRGPGSILEEILKLAPGGRKIEATEEDLKVIAELRQMQKSQNKSSKQNEVRNTAARIEKEKDLLRRGAAVS
ncbi:hypothetical protein GLAREA_07754 [Glarea lozoyensis ATCC 20868]|uniref:Uncharacterized protein n=1 Tax=Glarea lozoyensis (strain ATCC 20868 / MF5171) TaxID=1116229 RepID=S3D477_GLAL2|nr:uncharacterized protein GLAREA_07754 [Glarea lozoyensis ATCC 20868]EPE32620.1 hypothetical protein GLAREA_07754 [Glarea lozoyensis ATCC 20868]